MTIRISTLPNGLRVATDSMADAASVSLGIFIARGTRHEKPGTDGVAHLLEHMMFKGTTSRSARQIAEEIENVGGYLDAWTGREQTAYTAKVLSEHTSLAIQLLGDMLRESVLIPKSWPASVTSFCKKSPKRRMIPAILFLITCKKSPSLNKAWAGPFLVVRIS